MFQPVIKWSCSKRSQASEIIKYFPKQIDTYFEPFCGGASVLRALINSDIKVRKYVCSDLNGGLIELWNKIKYKPQEVAGYYEKLWNEMNGDHTKDSVYKRTYFESVRNRYNKEHSPLDFMFLNRTCFNGLIRYNKIGEFNSPYHLNRDGITPNKLRKIIFEWSDLLFTRNISFICCPYDYIVPSENDFIYLDPPYANTNGMYFGCFDNNKMFEWLKNVKCKWAMSYDGISGKTDNTYDVPDDLYNERAYLKSGNSSFKRIKQSDSNAIVYETLYLKK